MNTVTDAKPGIRHPEELRAQHAARSGRPREPEAHHQSFTDLAEPGVKVALCASQFRAAPPRRRSSEGGHHGQAGSEETSVSSVVTKVTLGQADAGVVYVTDVKAAGDKSEGVESPTARM